MSNAPKRMTAIDSGTEDGVDWAICEAPIYGAINGYVRIPEDHPWHGRDYDAIPVEVHGGLTFGSNSEGWIGFDTLHSCDYWPGVPFRDRDAIHWTAEMVAEETKKLARAVKAAA